MDLVNILQTHTVGTQHTGIYDSYTKLKSKADGFTFHLDIGIVNTQFVASLAFNLTNIFT